MIYTVSVTSQGQVSIPVKLRRQFGFDNRRKAIIEVKKDGLLMKPQTDIDALRGSLKTKKRIPFRKVRQAFGEYLAARSI